jgi:hypothetical protein
VLCVRHTYRAWTDDLAPFMATLRDTPNVLGKPLLYGCLSYFGNCFVQSMIGEYGLLLTISCLNVRQFSTVMAR